MLATLTGYGAGVPTVGEVPVVHVGEPALLHSFSMPDWLCEVTVSVPSKVEPSVMVTQAAPTAAPVELLSATPTGLPLLYGLPDPHVEL